jgi:phytoene dehydrogenase-like protein
MSQEFDAAVIGSGPNGLAAAITLAQAGRSVVVYEAADTVGGGTRTKELTLPGFRHDVCSAIHPMAVGAGLFAAMGLDAHGLEWVHSPACCAHPLADRPAAMLYRDVQQTAATLGGDGARWAAMVAPFIDRWTDLSKDALGTPGIPSSPVLMARFGLLAMQPASVLARSRFREAPARALLAGMASHSILPLERPLSSAIGLMLAVAGHARGWPMPRGGSQAIADALASALRSHGGTIRTGVRIRELDDIETAGPVLFDTSPRELVRIAGESLPRHFAERLLRFRHGAGVFKLDWALSEPIPWADPTVAQAATVHLGGTLPEIERSERAPYLGEHPDRPYVLLAQQSLFDDTRAPGGQHTGWAYCHVPAGSTRDMTATIEDMVEASAPGFKDTILATHNMDCADFEAYNPNYVGGDIAGGAADWDQLLTRPLVQANPYRTPNRRLYLCSASTPPGGGVHGMSGVNAVRAVRWG